MSRRRNFLLVAAASGVLVVFAAGLWRVFAERFGSGEMYPAYSTLNTGPMGARALFDAFARIGKPGVERNMFPLERFKERTDTTLVLAGAGSGFFGADALAHVEMYESLFAEGLHVVVTLDSRSIPPSAWSKEPVADPWGHGLGPLTNPPLPGRRSLSGEDPEEIRVSAGERWGFRFVPAINPDRAPKEGWDVSAPEAGPMESPRWFSVWRWADLASDWKPLAFVEGKPVIVRRHFGRGSLTLVSDSTFLSNEALWRAPKPAFLLWLLARESRLVFDETYHGSVSSPGIMPLARRYRLLGFFAGAALVLALYAWRAGTSLVPPHESVAHADDRPLAGAVGASGFSNLLRQSVPPRELLRHCFTEWARSPFVRRRVDDPTVAAVRDLINQVGPDRRLSPAARYRAVVGLLAAARRGGK
ncbi:MAG: DUF4350 domain-containing protein [Verrucomicrobiales bacterium]